MEVFAVRVFILTCFFLAMFSPPSAFGLWISDEFRDKHIENDSGSVKSFFSVIRA